MNDLITSKDACLSVYGFETYHDFYLWWQTLPIKSDMDKLALQAIVQSFPPKESSETIEKQLDNLEIYPNSIWSWIKSEDATEPSRVESSDSKCQASEIRDYGFKLLDALSEFIPKELLKDMYYNVSQYSDEDIVQNKTT